MQSWLLRLLRHISVSFESSSSPVFSGHSVSWARPPAKTERPRGAGNKQEKCSSAWQPSSCNGARVQVARSRISDALPLFSAPHFPLFYYSPQPSQPKIARIASSGLYAFIAFISLV